MKNIALLNSRSLISLTGSETVSFLQNLITCDIENLKSGETTFGALLTPQGKILFDFFVHNEGDQYLIDVDAGQRESLIKRLTFYKLRADVTIKPDERHIFACWPSELDKTHSDPRVAAMGHRLVDGALDCNASEENWHDHRIDVGVPQSGIDFELGSIFPHDALMDQFDKGGVDFEKGCYVGQEVVSRMHHRGTARNRFLKVSTPEASLPKAGEDITSGDKSVGKMGSSSGNTGLAILRIDRVKNALDEGHELTAGGRNIEVHSQGFVDFFETS